VFAIIGVGKVKWFGCRSNNKNKKISRVHSWQSMQEKTSHHDPSYCRKWDLHCRSPAQLHYYW